jgi:hypothetical protein
LSAARITSTRDYFFVRAFDRDVAFLVDRFVAA